MAWTTVPPLMPAAKRSAPEERRLSLPLSPHLPDTCCRYARQRGPRPLSGGRYVKVSLPSDLPARAWHDVDIPATKPHCDHISRSPRATNEEPNRTGVTPPRRDTGHRPSGAAQAPDTRSSGGPPAGTNREPPDHGRGAVPRQMVSAASRGTGRLNDWRHRKRDSRPVGRRASRTTGPWPCCSHVSTAASVGPEHGNDGRCGTGEATHHLRSR
jgi:hypothetical protein